MIITPRSMIIARRGDDDHSAPPALRMPYRSNGMQRRIGLRPGSPICRSWRHLHPQRPRAVHCPWSHAWPMLGVGLRKRSTQPKIETQSDAATLGVRLTGSIDAAADSRDRTRLGPARAGSAAGGIPTPTGRLTDPRPNPASAASHTRSVFNADARSGAPAPPQAVPTTSAATATVQRLPSQDAKHGSNSPATHPLAVSRRGNAGLADDRRRPAAAAGVTRVGDLHASGRF